MSRLIRTVSARAFAAVAAFAPVVSFAPEGRAERPERAPCVAFVGGTVHTPDGALSGGTVVVRGARIDGIAEGSQGPNGCQRVELAAEQHLTPGFVLVGSALGLVEVSLESYTVDASLAQGAKAPPVRASFDPSDAYNPLSSLIPIARHGGVTSTVSAARGGTVPGQALWADLAGVTQAASIQKRGAALIATVGAADGSRAARFAAIRELLDDGRWYAKHRADYDDGDRPPLRTTRADLEAIQPVLKGERPLVVVADRAADIEALMRLVDGQPGVKLVIAGGAEAWIHRLALAERRIPVAVDPLLFALGSFDQLHARPDNAALLAEAGVPVILTHGDAHGARSLRQLAGNAVREGMDHAAALAALTTVPADALGMGDHGRLAKGAMANLVVWSGDPFETTTHAERVWVHGVERSLETRQTRLRDRYRALPGSPTAPLSLP